MMVNMVTTMFEPWGPLIVKAHRSRSGAKVIDKSTITAFWTDYSEFKNERGVYVFGLRAGRGLTPGYVGEATKSFGQEVFTNDKLAKYGRFLAEYKKGNPILFFAVLPKKRGAPNATHIGDLEDFLIQAALTKNPDLQNVQGTKQAEWGIRGVLRSGKGNPGAAAKALKSMLAL